MKTYFRTTVLLLAFLAVTITVPSVGNAQDDAITAAKNHLRAIVSRDGDSLKKSYAPTIKLMPGHEFLKDRYRVAFPGARTTGAKVKRQKLVDAMVGDQLIEKEKADALLRTLRYKRMKVKPGDFVTDPSDPVESPDGKLKFLIEEGDVVVKVSPPGRDFILLHLREKKDKWNVVSEYLD